MAIVKYITVASSKLKRYFVRMCHHPCNTEIAEPSSGARDSGYAKRQATPGRRAGILVVRSADPKVWRKLF